MRLNIDSDRFTEDDRRKYREYKLAFNLRRKMTSGIRLERNPRRSGHRKRRTQRKRV